MLYHRSRGRALILSPHISHVLTMSAFIGACFLPPPKKCLCVCVCVCVCVCASDLQHNKVVTALKWINQETVHETEVRTYGQCNTKHTCAFVWYIQMEGKDSINSLRKVLDHHKPPYLCKLYNSLDMYWRDELHSCKRYSLVFDW